MRGSSDLWFATSNEHKFEEVRITLGEFGMIPRRLRGKGVEIQSDDIREIAKCASLQTFRLKKRPLFVEDTGLFIESLNGFPGPYASFVNRTVGPAAILKLLENAESRGAEFISAVAYCWGLSQVRVFTGRLRGEIAETMRGTGGFGFDPVFVPRGGERTLAELSLGEKCAISHRSLAVRALGTWLKSNRSR